MATVSAGNLLDTAILKIELLNRGEQSFKHDLQEIREGIQADRAAAALQSREQQLAAQLLLHAESVRIAAFAPADLRVAAFIQGAVGALQLAELLDNEASLASVRAPVVKKTEALLHGRITDDLQRAAGPVNVTLVDDKGAALGGVAPVETDSAGYYALILPAEVAANLPADAKFTLALSHAKQPLGTKTAPLALGAGIVHVQDVVLDRADLALLRPEFGDAAQPEKTRPAQPAAKSSPKRPSRSTK